MKTPAWTLSAFLFACSSASGTQGGSGTSPAPPELEVGKYAKVYQGDQGLVVTLVPLKAEEPKQALIEISGVETEIDGVVLRYQMKALGRDHYAWATELHGEPFHTLHSDRDWWTQERFSIFLPERPMDRVWVSYDEKATKEVKPESLAQKHREQVASGLIAELEKFNRDERRAYHEKELTGAMAQVEKACGHSVRTVIDWSSISDDLLKEYSISGFCDTVGGAVARMCQERPEGKDLFAGKVKRISCRFGDQVSVDLAGDGTLVWVTHEETPNQDDAAWDAVRAAFGQSRAVLRAGKVYLILDPGDAEVPLHYGDGKTFYRQPEGALSSSGSHRYFWGGAHDGKLEHEDGHWTLTCGRRTTRFQELGPKERQSILEAAELKGYIRERVPHALARDDRGTYYYIDRLIDEKGGKGFRVFIGPKGRLKLSQLIDIVDDDQGMIFATRNGKLRLLLQRNGVVSQAMWIAGKKRSKLTPLAPIGKSYELIYDKLGVYRGKKLGTVCEEV